MNVHSGRQRLSSRTASVRKDPAFGIQLFRLGSIMFFLLLIASVLFVHIYMNQRIAETEREIKSIKLNISRVNIELSNLSNLYEQNCSFEYIRRQMNRFGLNLIVPEPGQVTRMAILSPAQARQKAMLLERRRSGIAYSGRRNAVPSVR